MLVRTLDAPLQGRFFSGVGADASSWLNLIPKQDGVKLSALEFRTALRSRLLLPHPAIPPGARCVCARAIPVDPFGIHLAKCNHLQRMTIGTHDAFRNELQQFVRSSGADCKAEVVGIFQPEGDTPDLRRMDLVINVAGEPQMLCDVTVVSPTEWDPGPSRDPLHAAELRKNRDYADSALKAGKVFIPIAVDHGGRRGPQFERFFNETVNRYSANTGGDREAIRGYWNRRLTVAVQRGLARALIQRAHRVACRALASNLAADFEIDATPAGHAAMGVAPALAQDPLEDRSWDYPDTGGAGLGCLKCAL